MAEDSYIFLAGASRGLGREIANCLTEQNQKVKALLRSEESRPELETMGITVAMGDALDAASVERAMQGYKPIQAVISTMGGKPQEGERADYLGNRNLIDAAVKAGVKKFILISSIGSGESAVALPQQTLETLGPALAEKEKAEKHLIESSLTYTIIRPGGLKSESATGNGVVTENYQVAGSINRSDVAQLVCRCLFSEAANQKVLAAVDQQMMYGEPEFEALSL